MSKLKKNQNRPSSSVIVEMEQQEYKTMHKIPKPPSLWARYFVLSLLILPPIILGCALLWFYMRPLAGSFYVLLPL